MNNLAKDMTKREFCVLVLVAGSMPVCAGADWINRFGDQIIEVAEIMAEKLLQHQQSKAFGAFTNIAPDKDAVVIMDNDPGPVTVDFVGSGIDIESEDDRDGSS